MGRQEELLEELQEMNRNFRKFHHSPKPYGPCHPAAFVTLLKIQEACETEGHEAGAGVGELAGLLDVSMPAVSKMLRNLEEKRLICRWTDPKNRRNVYVKLTEEGERVVSEASEHERIRIRQIAEALGEEDLEHLLRIMNKLMVLECSDREVRQC